MMLRVKMVCLSMANTNPLNENGYDLTDEGYEELGNKEDEDYDVAYNDGNEKDRC